MKKDTYISQQNRIKRFQKELDKLLKKYKFVLQIAVGDLRVINPNKK